MMKLGYARVSTSEQDTAAQVSALKSAGCEKIFREKASGGRWDTPRANSTAGSVAEGRYSHCLAARPTFALPPRSTDDYGAD